MKALNAIATYGLIAIAFALVALTVLDVVVWP
jgi:hypothetical protein